MENTLLQFLKVLFWDSNSDTYNFTNIRKIISDDFKDIIDFESSEDFNSILHDNSHLNKYFNNSKTKYGAIMLLLEQSTKHMIDLCCRKLNISIIILNDTLLNNISYSKDTVFIVKHSNSSFAATRIFNSFSPSFRK